MRAAAGRLRHRSLRHSRHHPSIRTAASPVADGPSTSLYRMLTKLLLLQQLIYASAFEEKAEVRVRVGAHGIEVVDDEVSDRGAWAAEMSEVRLGENGVDDEILPTISVGAEEATLMDAPDANGMALLRRQQTAGARVDVLENQLVIVSGLESKEDRKRRAALGLGEENVLASQLACHNINGTAMFMLVGRQPVPGSPQLHELGFFDRELWATFLEYMQRARANAPFFGGTAAAWALKIQCVIARLNSCDQGPLAPDATQADAC